MKRSVVLVVCGVVLTSHCATVGQLTFADPVVTLREVHIAGLGLTGGTLTMVLDIDNPNPFSLSGVGIVAALALNGTPFGTARWDQGATVPANDIGTVEIPLQFTWSGVGAGARSFLSSGSVPYSLGGDISVSTRVGEFTRQITTEGSVTLRDLIGRF